MEAPGSDGSLLEALFRITRPEGELLAALRALNIDPDQLAAKYTSRQWVQALELYRRHLFSSLDVAEGNRKLGHALAMGFTQTISGTLLLATLPLFSPQRLLRNWPRLVRMGRTDVELDVTETGPRSADIHSKDPVDVPAALNLGMLEFAFERLGVRARFEVELLGPGEVVMHCSW